MDVQDGLGQRSQRLTQQTVRRGLHDVLAGQPRPQTGTGPFFGVSGRLPACLGVADAVLIESCMGVAEDTPTRQAIP